MYEYKYSIGVRHKSTGERLKLEVWAEDVDAAHPQADRHPHWPGM